MGLQPAMRDEAPNEYTVRRLESVGERILAAQATAEQSGLVPTAVEVPAGAHLADGAPAAISGGLLFGLKVRVVAPTADVVVLALPNRHIGRYEVVAYARFPAPQAMMVRREGGHGPE